MSRGWSRRSSSRGGSGRQRGWMIARRRVVCVACKCILSVRGNERLLVSIMLRPLLLVVLLKLLLLTTHRVLRTLMTTFLLSATCILLRYFPPLRLLLSNLLLVDHPPVLIHTLQDPQNFLSVQRRKRPRCLKICVHVLNGLYLCTRCELLES